MVEYVSHSAEETREIGGKVVQRFGVNRLYCLYGPLAAGKTTLVKGMAEEIGVERRVVSPSYILLREYEGEYPLHHIDLFRLGSSGELIEAGLDEYIVDPRGVVAIEWAERAEGILPEDRVDVRIEITGDEERKVATTSNLD